jgi:hypothetical protein
MKPKRRRPSMTSPILSTQTARPSETRRVDIEFLYLDLDVCSRCRGTDQNLETALSEISRLLELTGVEVQVRKTLVASEKQARSLGFYSSPTIRVNGKEIALEFRESRCESCEECAGNGEIHCRVWVYMEKEYTEAPKAMIIDAILREIYGGLPQPVPEPPPFNEVPENLKRFFAGKAQKTAAISPCCPPAEAAVCCDPSEKPACCGTSGPETCGCR